MGSLKQEDFEQAAEKGKVWEFFVCKAQISNANLNWECPKSQSNEDKETIQINLFFLASFIAGGYKICFHICLQGDAKVESRNVTTPDTLMDLIRQMFPPNLIQVNPRHPDRVCVCVSDRQLNMVICRAVTAV